MPFKSAGRAGGDLIMSPSVYSNRQQICKGVFCAEGLSTSATISTPFDLPIVSFVPTGESAYPKKGINKTIKKASRVFFMLGGASVFFLALDSCPSDFYRS